MKTFRLVMIVVICALAVCTAGAQTYDIIQERNGLINVFARLKAAQPVKILFIAEPSAAGSVGGTASGHWAAKTADWFKRQYPRADVQSAFISCSNCGAAGAAVLWPSVSCIKPDLVFVCTAQQDIEAAGEAEQNAVGRNAERLIRLIRTDNPTTEICFVYGLRKEMLAPYKSGRLPGCIYSHDVAAAHYRVSSVNFGAAFAEQINAGKAAYSDVCSESGQLTEVGNAQASDLLTGYLAGLSLRVGRGVLPYRLSPPASALADVPLRPIAIEGGALPTGWQRIPDVALLPGVRLPLVTAAPGAPALKISFDGTGVVLLITGTKPVGAVEFSIDGGTWKRQSVPADESDRCFWSLQVPDGLAAGHHSLEVRAVSGSPLQLVGVATEGTPAK
jgi:hypothetical protein